MVILPFLQVFVEQNIFILRYSLLSTFILIYRPSVTVQRKIIVYDISYALEHQRLTTPPFWLDLLSRQHGCIGNFYAQDQLPDQREPTFQQILEKPSMLVNVTDIQGKNEGRKRTRTHSQEAACSRPFSFFVAYWCSNSWSLTDIYPIALFVCFRVWSTALGTLDESLAG